MDIVQLKHSNHHYFMLPYSFNFLMKSQYFRMVEWLKHHFAQCSTFCPQQTKFCKQYILEKHFTLCLDTLIGTHPIFLLLLLAAENLRIMIWICLQPSLIARYCFMGPQSHAGKWQNLQFAKSSEALFFFRKCTLKL